MHTFETHKLIVFRPITRIYVVTRCPSRNVSKRASTGRKKQSGRFLCFLSVTLPNTAKGVVLSGFDIRNTGPA